MLQATKDWVRDLPIWKKALGVLATVAIALFVAGWNARSLFSEQVGLPSLVRQTTARVDNLEHRMDAAEEVLNDISLNTARLKSLASKVDSLDAMASDTYCLVRAHALSLDPLAECTLSQRGRREQ